MTTVSIWYGMWKPAGEAGDPGELLGEAGEAARPGDTIPGEFVRGEDAPEAAHMQIGEGMLCAAAAAAAGSAAADSAVAGVAARVSGGDDPMTRVGVGRGRVPARGSLPAAGREASAGSWRGERGVKRGESWWRERGDGACDDAQ